MFRRIRGDRLGTILLEVGMLVVGINLAMWFESRFEAHQDSQKERTYLVGLKRDLQQDVALLTRLAAENQAKSERLGSQVPKLGTLADMPQEEAASLLFDVSGYFFFVPEDFSYRAMQESGEFRLLTDQETRESLLRQHRRYLIIENMQKNFMQALDDEYMPLLLRSFDFATFSLTDPALASNLVFRNFVAFAARDSDERGEACSAAAQKAEVLISLIDRQLDDAGIQ